MVDSLRSTLIDADRDRRIGPISTLFAVHIDNGGDLGGVELREATGETDAIVSDLSGVGTRGITAFIDEPHPRQCRQIIIIAAVSSLQYCSSRVRRLAVYSRVASVRKRRSW